MDLSILLTTYLPIAICIIVGIVVVNVLLKLYRTNTANEAFVRTGLGREKVVTGGGAVVLPSPLHKITRVNLASIQLPIRLAESLALITCEFLKVDIEAIFNVRVKKEESSIKKNAETLGEMSFDAEKVKEFLEAKLTGALRNTVAQLKIDELQQNRSKLIEEFKNSVEADLAANGFELESITINKLTQTNVTFFESNNVFDERGRTIITKISEEKRKERNDIEQQTKVQIVEKDLKTTEQVLELDRQKAEKTAEQERAIAEYKAEQQRKAEEARINAEKAIELAEQQKILALKEQAILNEKISSEKEIEKRKALEIAEQDKAISIQNKSKEESLAKAEADKARAEAIAEEQNVLTVEAVAQAKRASDIEVIEAKKEAEKEAVKIKVAALTEKEAAKDRAEAILTEAQAEAEAKKLTAQAEADKLKIQTEAEANQIKELSKANEEKYRVEAEGKRQLVEATNAMSEAQIKYEQLKVIVDKMPEIIHESSKPMEKIDSIKVVGGIGLGLNSGNISSKENGTENGGISPTSNGIVDQVYNGALQYKVNSTLVNEVLSSVGMSGDSLNGLQAPILEAIKQD